MTLRKECHIATNKAGSQPGQLKLPRSSLFEPCGNRKLPMARVLKTMPFGGVTVVVRHLNTLSDHLAKEYCPMANLIYRHDFEAQKLVTDYPAQVYDRNKKIVFAMTLPHGAAHTGVISVSRWKPVSLPLTIERDRKSPSFELREDYFNYESTPKEQLHWYMNFAHYDLFCAYGGSLFAQDEMQVAEHPALASLRHALIDSESHPLTVEDGVATPILIAGVERRCAIATDANLDEGRPYGLYGNSFSHAKEEAIRQATRVLDPPTISNIIAMEAPACSVGRYSRKQIEFILSTAFTGFRAAVHESRRNVSPNVQTAIHTGYWGCGAYGGNRELMPLLQMIAACCAGVDVLVFHTGGDSGGYAQSVSTLAEILPTDTTVDAHDLISRIEDVGYIWGVSDGN